MGLLRLLLAVSVFCGHSTPLGQLAWLPDGLAVELFFIISGFYMQLVLSSRYTLQQLGPGWALQFYKARYGRIFPIYACGWSLTVAAALCLGHMDPITTWHAVLSLPGTFTNCLFEIFLVMTNLTIFFQDVTMFFAVHHGHVVWSGNFRQSDFQLWPALADFPCWSLGLELSFYILAPWLLNLHKSWLLPITAASLLAKFVVLTIFHLDDPWTYRFFPFELGYFLLGALACRNRAGARLAILASPAAARLLAYGLVILLAAIGAAFPDPMFTTPLACALILPFLAAATSTSAWDRRIGELSFPFYVTHILCIQLVIAHASSRLHSIHANPVWAALLLTIIISSLITAADLKWIEPWRKRFAVPPAGHQPDFRGTVITSGASLAP